MNTHWKSHLGRLPSKHDPRTLRLKNYLLKPRLYFPSSYDPPKNVVLWGVQGNDDYGNCVIVCAAHMIQNMKAQKSNLPSPISDSAVIELSRIMGALNGYNILDRLKYWRKEGMWSNKLWAFTMIQPSNPVDIKVAIAEFGSADIGLNLPLAWQDDQIWDVGSGRSYQPGSWGGHSVPLVGYDEKGVWCVTWGELQKITWEGLFRYCDEAYAVIDPEWIALDGLTPSGFDLAKLHADLQVVTGEE